MKFNLFINSNWCQIITIFNWFAKISMICKDFVCFKNSFHHYFYHLNCLFYYLLEFTVNNFWYFSSLNFHCLSPQPKCSSTDSVENSTCFLFLWAHCLLQKLIFYFILNPQIRSLLKCPPFDFLAILIHFFTCSISSKSSKLV